MRKRSLLLASTQWTWDQSITAGNCRRPQREETGPKKGIMTRKIYETNNNHGPEYNKILINHWRWLEDQGPSYKQQASSCKLQAASLTRRLNSVIGD